LQLKNFYRCIKTRKIYRPVEIFFLIITLMLGAYRRYELNHYQWFNISCNCNHYRV